MDKKVQKKLEKFYAGKSVLVIGSEGYVGSALVSRLRKLKACVTELDYKTTPHSYSMHNLDDTRELIGGSELVFNTACKNIYDSRDHRDRGWWDNTHWASIVARCAEQLGAQLVHFSSSSVYGNTPPRDMLGGLAEDDPMNPTSEYGWSKARGEEAVRHYNPSAIIVRPTNVYGPSPKPSNVGVVAKFIEAARTGQRCWVNKDWREFIYIEDLLDAVLVLPMYASALGETFNISSGQGCSIQNLADSLGVTYQITNRKSEGNITVRWLNSNKLRWALPWWEPRTLEVGLKATVAWAKAKGGKR